MNSAIQRLIRIGLSGRLDNLITWLTDCGYLDISAVYMYGPEKKAAMKEMFPKSFKRGNTRIFLNGGIVAGRPALLGITSRNADNIRVIRVILRLPDYERTVPEQHLKHDIITACNESRLDVVGILVRAVNQPQLRAIVAARSHPDY